MKLWTPNQSVKNGRFVIQKVLGGGGFGVTYSAVEQRSGKLCAIKTLNPLHQNEENFPEKQEKFVNEAIKLASCQHPHIVKVYEVIQEEGMWGMVMEYIEGEDLGVYVDKHGFLSETEALRYIDQVGQALEYVHKQGFLHRDIKPNNIILRSQRTEAVLIDFGLAREFTIGKTLSMTSARTEGYAPIEQYERQGRFTAATDVYALAATLYALVTGVVPFPSNYRKYAELPPPKQHNPEISDRVNDAIMTGMGIEQQDRPQTVREFRELLGVVKTPEPRFGFEVVIVNSRGEIINRESKQAKYYSEELGNGITLEMVEIKAGRFTMGAPETEEGSRETERPQHEVTVQDFFMGKYPVTQAQWREVAGLPQVNRELKPDPSHFKGENNPVERVSWYDAVEFCSRLSAKTKRTYRLPSEAEWEYGCRGGTKTPFHFGETITTDLANYHGIDWEKRGWLGSYALGTKGIYREKTTPVGSFGVANGYGLYDIHGNVWEWCADHWHNNYEGAPTDGTGWLDNDNYSHLRLLRGGSWFSYPGNCRSASRNFQIPAFVIYDFGFRVVCGGGAARTL
ncbi:bifunctional serine/threonine-protein kinase/formylglycine-generating enzyme family protein [Aetokthonos hydrillicola Thurmond2011]|jgi:formylglycine-generating enzyme required for sulfatase activity|uniref:Bifunctional serine/threonine-protein kinase/formylglycine-generating enzyme family protein n=1 Tax=Aetokthonos hydrillicola Thurmond2011 TaxID=2712845 RepID=A0AAP5MD74_9CYAN|nr:bifunctional serine/threonine-protein kinase/formylglycine-generating enzyme family protein [Aetokthonos hydrillicola]MBO3457232.1 SUMF1/EgtB/PvdO family nonheme iron enzyme [Aetokthonos hydrillicola CCALA 1050]MBW4587582.1 SUMF1/EgtB/PvdO family nonheme iron enzyme [Aetokthonos hydrillicola CCALA 1050]MDR9900152.1 bifunctional serine/threonine-protein kinase/formylglycine-generating enzyme family protein [Aetokthonos hydrillicola Thurmond2011]